MLKNIKSFSSFSLKFGHKTKYDNKNMLKKLPLKISNFAPPHRKIKIFPDFLYF